LEIEELTENSEIKCDVCNLTMLYRNKKILVLDTNEEFNLNELTEREEGELEEFEEEHYFEEEEEEY